MKVSFVRVLGVLAIVHGLSQAILPLRGSFEPASAVRDYTPILLYIVSTIGFLLAGIGLLGVRRLSRFISPLLVLAAGLSSVAIVRLGDADLVGGVALNVVLMALGLWRGYAGWPAKDPVEIDHFEHLAPSTSR